jgi:hypothetical protein
MDPQLAPHPVHPVDDDFGVKYVGEEHAQHLLKSVRKHYKCCYKMEGEQYCGLTLKWDYTKCKVQTIMPGYISKGLQWFNHPNQDKPQDQPHPHVPPNYGAKLQFPKPEDASPKLDKADKKFVMQVTGTFLFYARAVDGTKLTALSALTSEEANPTEHTMQKCKQFFDYAATHPNAVLTYRPSNMVLTVHSDASYLSKPVTRSRAGGHMIMAGQEEIPLNNGAVLNISQIIKLVMSLAVEAELGALFINPKTAVPMRKTLEELGHPQPPTPMQTDNSTAYGVLNNKITSKATKAINICFHWLQCHDAQGQFRFYWRPGSTNLADYWTKHHPASHHRTFRPEILTLQKFTAIRKFTAAAA